MRAIAGVHSGVFALTTNQNVTIAGIASADRPAIEKLLDAYGMTNETSVSGLRRNSMACVALPTCALAMAEAERYLPDLLDKLDEIVTAAGLTDDPITIRMSGCPNGCSQHHIANIGFYGASLKVGERQIPAYIPHIGGNYEGGEVVFGTRLKSRLPAKRVPEAVERWIELYESERNEGEEFNAFADRTGAAGFEEIVKDLTMPAEFSLETMQQFIDWNRSSPYKVERGEGECAI